MTAYCHLRRWWRDERGQDLVEYSLLLTFVVLNSAALLLYSAESVETIWGEAVALLDRAHTGPGL